MPRGKEKQEPKPPKPRAYVEHTPLFTHGFAFQRFARYGPVGGFGEEFDLFFGTGQHAAAMADEEIAALVFDQALFESGVAVLDLRQDLLELAQRVLETLRGGLDGFLGH